MYFLQNGLEDVSNFDKECTREESELISHKEVRVLTSDEQNFFKDFDYSA